MILVTGHNYSYTDVDSLISSIILSEILNWKGLNSKPVLINKNAIQQSSTDIIRKIGDIKFPEVVSKEDIINNDIALVDHNNPLESYGTLGISKIPEICIDHHTDSLSEAKVKIIKRVGATCTIIAQMIKEENIPISDLYAKALVYGIACDTKGLKSRKKCQEDLDMIDYLYENYNIDVELDVIVNHVLITTDVLNMTIDQILRNSLKEYLGGRIGIAAIEVLNDDFNLRIEEIKEKGWNTKYPLYIFTIFKQHTNETIIYFFDKRYKCFPKEIKYSSLISRAQDLVPYVLKTIAN